MSFRLYELDGFDRCVFWTNGDKLHVAFYENDQCVLVANGENKIEASHGFSSSKGVPIDSELFFGLIDLFARQTA
jgi:hypothetical protein